MDDDPVFREELADLLRSEGHDVEAVGSAAEAVNLVTPGRWDAVLTDIRMPQHSGLDLVKDVRRRAPSTYSIVVTGQTDEPTERQSFEAGAIHFLAKPFTLAQLDEALASVRDASALRRRLCPAGGLPRDLIAPPTMVGWLSESAPPAGTGWVRLALEAANPWASLPAVGRFCREAPSAAVVVDLGARMLEDIGPSPAIVFVGRLRAAIFPTSPLFLQVHLPAIGDETLFRLSWALAGRPPSAAMAALAVPARQRWLRRLARGEASDALSPDGADTDDRSRRIHLERLSEYGAVALGADGWRLTPEGRGLADFLDALDSETSSMMFSAKVPVLTR